MNTFYTLLSGCCFGLLIGVVGYGVFEWEFWAVVVSFAVHGEIKGRLNG